MGTRNMERGYHGIQNAVFAPKTAEGYGTPIKIGYVKNLSYGITGGDDITQYANNEEVCNIPGQQRVEGSLGCTGRSYELEKAIGSYMETTNGGTDVAIDNYTLGALGYETVIHKEDRSIGIARAWIYDVNIDSKYTQTHDTDTDTKTFGEIVYNYRSYGVPAQTTDGEIEKDANGMHKTIFRKTCLPGETGYDTFLNSVPAPTLTTPTGA